MTQGIRSFSNQKFAEHLPLLQSGELNGTQFRAKVMGDVVQQFGITVNSAATHYNHSLKTQRAADPKSVSGLGRAEDKKGGRPLITPVTVIKVKTGEVVAENVSRAKAKEIIDQAAAKKRAKLMIKVAEVAPEVPAATETVVPEAEQTGLQEELAEAQATA